MSECLENLAVKMIKLLPRAESGSKYAAGAMRRLLRRWVEFTDYDLDRIRELAAFLGYELYFDNWAERIQTVAHAHLKHKT